MTSIITDKKEITDLHRKFHQRLNKLSNERMHCWVGYPGGSFEDTVKYFTDLNIWISKGEHDNKFYNAFGIGRPVEGKTNSLNGEINFPYEGSNRRIGGAFGRDTNGNIVVLHRGKIGGGKPGIGKTYFMDNFRGDTITAIDGDRETTFCLIGELNALQFPEQVANFILEIYRIKNIEDGQSASDFKELSEFIYTDEKSGVTVTEKNEPKTITRTHGIVVNALAKELKLLKYEVANDKNRDLFIHERNRIKKLFEIKTSSSTQSLYSAVGQLLIYSIPVKNPVDLIAVFPDKLSRTVENHFSKLGIKILYFHWENNKPKFPKLTEML